MSESILNDLLEALSFSPDNIPLRSRIAKIYLDQGIFDEAEMHCLEILKSDEKNVGVKFDLATCYFKMQKFSAATVILEELIKTTSDINYLELLCYCHLNEENYSDAQQVYQDLLAIDASYANEDFDTKLKVSGNRAVTDNTEIENFTDEDVLRFLKKPKLDFSSVGGMKHVKDEIDMKIIKPLEHAALYKAYGKKIGGGILMYGPPGCGKTHLARATAGEINANFINVGINEILDMWLGNSERNLHEIFETARKNTPCVLFIDEIDALGANRNDMNKTAGRTVINQFLAELDGIESDNEGVLVMGATNAPWYLDPAFRRPGRFDRIIFVSPPDQEAKTAIYKLMLKDKPCDPIDFPSLAKASKEFSGADISAVIDIAIEKKLKDSFKDGIPKPLTTKDFLKAIKLVKPSTKEWFGSAKNYALYANDAGLYDEILSYLNIKK